MKALGGIIGAFIGGLASLLFYGKAAAGAYAGASEFLSPDQFEETYSTVYLGVTVASMAVGYLIGWFIGKRMDRRVRQREA